jgi:hypothetical protein
LIQALVQRSTAGLVEASVDLAKESTVSMVTWCQIAIRRSFISEDSDPTVPVRMRVRNLMDGSIVRRMQ